MSAFRRVGGPISGRSLLPVLMVPALAAAVALGFGVGVRYARQSEDRPGAAGSAPTRVGPSEDASAAVSPAGKADRKRKSARPGEASEREDAAESSGERPATAPPGGSRPKSREEKLEAARKVYQAFMDAANNTADPEEMIQASRLMAELDADSTLYFAERYRASRGGDPEEREVALSLALTAGGPEAARLIGELLSDPQTPAVDRANLGATLTGANGALFSIKRLPVAPELADTAFKLISSTATVDRVCAAGLLGGLDTAQSQQALRTLAWNDQEHLDVRAAAVRALGNVGDRQVFSDLKAKYEIFARTPTGAKDHALMDAYRASLSALARRYPD